MVFILHGGGSNLQHNGLFSCSICSAGETVEYFLFPYLVKGHSTLIQSSLEILPAALSDFTRNVVCKPFNPFPGDLVSIKNTEHTFML